MGGMEEQDYSLKGSGERRRKRSVGGMSRCGDISKPEPIRSTANARERDRTHSVNSAFIILRQLIPTEPADRKLSKIETLRLATSYISHLHTILMVGLDCMEQPCIKALIDRRLDENTRRLMGSSSVCTFCLSASKIKNQHMVHESYMYRTDGRGGLIHIPR